MIYNDTLKNSYGSFNELTGISSLSRFRPKPTQSDYAIGYIDRCFVKKVNENVIFEIDPSNKSFVQSVLYKAVEIKWKISGPRNNVIVNGIINKAGVENENKAEIDRVMKEDDIDLSRTLSNLFEYWKGS